MKIQSIHYLLYPLSMVLCFTLIFGDWIIKQPNQFVLGSVTTWVATVITYYGLKHMETSTNEEK